MQFNADRLTYYFTTLCEIDSPSKGEGKLSSFLKDLFAELGAAQIIEDNSAITTGSDCGNFIARFAGSRSDLEPIFFNCHLDVINPCIGVKARKVNDVFYSFGV